MFMLQRHKMKPNILRLGTYRVVFHHPKMPSGGNVNAPEHETDSKKIVSLLRPFH